MVRVEVTEGVLEGEVLDSVLGGTYWSFKGVPYAAPPLGDLRFKAPQPAQPWEGVREAKKHGPICPQYDLFNKTLIVGNEDCLYLNVYTPDLNPDKLLPVMFWIHGGGWISGSGNSDIYGPDFLVSQGVIVVTFNYRLGALGFLSLGTRDIPGNAGMKDQVAALRWVNKNIKNFGGDPINITIFGESAGGASVTYHLISPMTKGLFKRAIIQSGSNVGQWATAFEPRLRAETIARHLGKETTDDKELFEFFKSVPAKDFIRIPILLPVIIEEAVNLKVTLMYAVVNEKQFDNEERFFCGDVLENLYSGIHEGVEVMIGYTAHDGTVALGAIEGLKEKFDTYLQSFVPGNLVLKCSPKVQLEIGRKVKEYYLYNKNINSDKYDRLTDFLTINVIAYDIMQYAKICSIKNIIYFYKFDYYSERNIFTEIFNANELRQGKRTISHCDDLSYLFHIEMPNISLDKNSKSFKMIQNTVKLWTDFAKFGNPTPDGALGVTWPTYDSVEQKYLHIHDEALVVAAHPDKEDVEFWDSILRQYQPQKRYL